MKTILATIFLCVVVASGIEHFNNTSNAMTAHNHQTEVAMAQYLGK